MVINWVNKIYHEMSIRNAVIAILGNKSDSETLFEIEIENMIFNVRQLHENMRPECTTRNCRHLIFNRCSALTGLNLDNILTELGSTIIT
jgi:preprotein translocase subunit SecB